MTEVIDADLGSVPMEPSPVGALHRSERRARLRKLRGAIVQAMFSTHQYPSPPPHQFVKPR